MPVPISRRVPPLSGWGHREILDAEDLDLDGESNCDLCGTHIRWIHIIDHENFSGPLAVGVCCAERCCTGFDVAGAERAFKTRIARRKNFMNPSIWRPTKKNPENISRKVNVPGAVIRVVIVMNERGYGIGLFTTKKNRTVAKEYPLGQFTSRAEAQRVAFELIEKKKRRE